MSDGQILLTIVLIIAGLLVFGPMIVGAIIDGRNEWRKKHHPPRPPQQAFRQYPTFPVQGEQHQSQVDQSKRVR